MSGPPNHLTHPYFPATGSFFPGWSIPYSYLNPFSHLPPPSSSSTLSSPGPQGPPASSVAPFPGGSQMTLGAPYAQMYPSTGHPLASPFLDPAMHPNIHHSHLGGGHTMPLVSPPSAANFAAETEPLSMCFEVFIPKSTSQEPTEPKERPIKEYLLKSPLNSNQSSSDSSILIGSDASRCEIVVKEIPTTQLELFRGMDHFLYARNIANDSCSTVWINRVTPILAGYPAIQMRNRDVLFFSRSIALRIKLSHRFSYPRPSNGISTNQLSSSSSLVIGHSSFLSSDSSGLVEPNQDGTLSSTAGSPKKGHKVQDEPNLSPVEISEEMLLTAAEGCKDGSRIDDPPIERDRQKERERKMAKIRREQQQFLQQTTEPQSAVAKDEQNPPLKFKSTNTKKTATRKSPSADPPSSTAVMAPQNFATTHSISTEREEKRRLTRSTKADVSLAPISEKPSYVLGTKGKLIRQTNTDGIVVVEESNAIQILESKRSQDAKIWREIARGNSMYTPLTRRTAAAKSIALTQNYLKTINSTEPKAPIAPKTRRIDGRRRKRSATMATALTADDDPSIYYTTSESEADDEFDLTFASRNSTSRESSRSPSRSRSRSRELRKKSSRQQKFPKMITEDAESQQSDSSAASPRNSTDSDQDRGVNQDSSTIHSKQEYPIGIHQLDLGADQDENPALKDAGEGHSTGKEPIDLTPQLSPVTAASTGEDDGRDDSKPIELPVALKGHSSLPLGSSLFGMSYDSSDEENALPEENSSQETSEQKRAPYSQPYYLSSPSSSPELGQKRRRLSDPALEPTVMASKQPRLF